ncbi:MAG: 3-ketosteroid-9-alpha-hydroxylase reductase subunit, partial [Pseudomonadota bacterium]
GCTFGLCGTCKVKKTAGEVHMVHNGGISDEDVADGFILACCSRPLGKVEVAV